MKYHVSVDEQLGAAVEAVDVTAAARQSVARLGAGAGDRLYVRWNVVPDPRDSSAWLLARVAEVAVAADWLAAKAPPAAAPTQVSAEPVASAAPVAAAHAPGGSDGVKGRKGGSKPSGK